MKTVIICDIDGVVADSSIRLKRYSNYKALERGDYNAFRVSMQAYNCTSLEDDVVIENGCELLHSLINYYSPTRVIFLTSRGEESRGNTLDWLNTYVSDVKSKDLIMRPSHPEIAPGIYWREGDPKFDHVAYKRSVVENLMADGYEIVMAIDDHAPICDMYQSIGIPAIVVKWPGIDCLTTSGMNMNAGALVGAIK